MTFNEDGSRHYNCCARTFMANCGDMDQQTADDITALFGRGMRVGSICGCITGALLAIGYKYGDSDKAEDLRVKFVEKFQNEHGTLLCDDLLESFGGVKGMCTAMIDKNIVELAKLLEE